MEQFSAFTLLLLAAMVRGTVDQTAEYVSEGAYQVAVVVGRVVEQYLAGCHLVLAGTARHSLLVQHTSRRISESVGSVVVEAEALFSQDQPAQDHLLQGLWGEARHTCRALILHLTDDSLAFRFFETSELWLWPETRLVIVGRKTGMKAFLQHPCLRNAKHTLYLALHTRKTPTPTTKLERESSKKGWSEKAEAYRRCLYCNIGEVDVQLLHRWNLTSGEDPSNDLFSGQPEAFMGHKFEVVALPFFPITNFRRNSETPGTVLTSLDSVDVRMLNTFATQANFTYEVREPWDGQWGVEEGNGNWTGMVGTLQHQKADFCLVLTLTPARKRVVQFSTIYIRESVVIFSLKPETLPQHLAIIRPFTEVVWLLLSASIVVWGISMWLLQKLWSWASGGDDMRFSSALLYSWGVLLEKWTFDPSVNLTSRLTAGLWMLACMILTTAYRSSLVAHLVVQDKKPEVNTFHDLLDRDPWGWGASYSGGSLTTYLNTHPDSAFQDVLKSMQYAPEEEQFQRVLEGGYSYITYKYGGVASVAARYTNNRGYTPIHVSKTEYLEFAGEGWAFRRGAPFLPRISGMMQHLMEGGFIDYWLDDILASHLWKEKVESEKGEEKTEKEFENLEVDDGQVVLGLQHLLGAFYLLLLGYGLALLTLLGENLTC